jgi:hypothetical protein
MDIDKEQTIVQEMIESDIAEIALSQEQTTELEENLAMNDIDAEAEPATDNELTEDSSPTNSVLENVNTNQENDQTVNQENTENAAFTLVVRKRRKHKDAKLYSVANKENQNNELKQRAQGSSKNY